MLTGDAFVWIAVGRLVPAKDYPNLLRAFAQVQQAHPSTQLWIAGEGDPDSVQPSPSSSIEEPAQETNAARWLGAIKDRRKALVLITTDALCMPRRESLTDSASECSEGLRQVLRTAVQSDVSIYAVDPRGLVADAGSPAETGYREPSFPPAFTRGTFDGARYLADASGGFSVINTNNLSDGFARDQRAARVRLIAHSCSVRERSQDFRLRIDETGPGRIRFG